MSSVLIVSFPSAVRASIVAMAFTAGCNSHFSGNNAGGHSNNSIAHQHNNACYKFPERGNRRNIAIANCSDRYNCPVNTVRDACETIFTAFNKVHYRTEDNNCCKNHHHENADFSETAFYGLDQELHFVYITYKLQDPEHPKQPQRPHYQ